MSRMPFYKDPIFMQKAQTMGQPLQYSGGPFTATRNAVANSLMANRNLNLANTLGMQGAQFGRNQAMFNNNQAWQTWQGNTARASREIQAQEQFAYNRRMEEARRRAERKARRRGMVGSALGAVGGALGSIFGGPIGGVAGQTAGQTAGGMF